MQVFISASERREARIHVQPTHRLVWDVGVECPAGALSLLVGARPREARACGMSADGTGTQATFMVAEETGHAAIRCEGIG